MGIQRYTCNIELLDECPHLEPLLKDHDGGYVKHSDHAAELAEWKQRAERAEAYVAGHDQWSTFKTAEEMHAELVRVRTQRDSLCLAFNKANKENALLRAECEAWRAWDRQLRMDLEGQVSFAGRYLPGVNRNLTQARAATDAAGILKGAGT